MVSYWFTTLWDDILDSSSTRLSWNFGSLFVVIYLTNAFFTQHPRWRKTHDCKQKTLPQLSPIGRRRLWGLQRRMELRLSVNGQRRWKLVPQPREILSSDWKMVFKAELLMWKTNLLPTLKLLREILPLLANFLPLLPSPLSVLTPVIIHASAWQPYQVYLMPQSSP